MKFQRDIPPPPPPLPVATYRRVEPPRPVPGRGIDPIARQDMMLWTVSFLIFVVVMAGILVSLVIRWSSV